MLEWIFEKNTSLWYKIKEVQNYVFERVTPVPD